MAAILLIMAALLTALVGTFGDKKPVRAKQTWMPLLTRGDRAAPFSADGQPSWSAPVVVSPADGTVWVANPDAGSVTLVEAAVYSISPKKITEIVVGQEPWSLAISPDGAALYVVDRKAGTLVVVDSRSRQVRTSIAIGPEPIAVALSPLGAQAYVTVSSADEIAVVDLSTMTVRERIEVAPRPYAIAVTDDGDADEHDEQMYVTHLLAFPLPDGTEGADDSRAGRVTMIDAMTGADEFAVREEITLTADVHGFPNLLSGITISGERAWVPHVRAAPDLPSTLTTMVFAAVATIDLKLGAEAVMERLPLNDQEIFGSPVNNPMTAIPSLDQKTLYIVLSGSDLVGAVDISKPQQPRLIGFLPVGRNPRGMALSPDGRWGYVMNYMSRSLTLLDLAQFQSVAEITMTAETLTPEVVRGKIRFYSASDPRLSQGSWISCASCHPDGSSDGVTWMFPDGPRQTPPLWNASQTLPWHWSAALDEGQDVEETIQVIQHGLGLAAGGDPPQLGAPNAGRSAGLDDLVAFLTQGIRTPAPAVSAISPVDITHGRTLFLAAGCAECHGGPTWTSSALPGAAGTLDPDGNGMVDDVLREVGTHNARDVRGESGFDPPSLLDVGLTAPYLHDGSMPDIEALLLSGHPHPQDSGNGLEAGEIAMLAGFLRAIGADTLPVEMP